MGKAEDRVMDQGNIYRIQSIIMYAGMIAFACVAHFKWGTVGLWAPLLLMAPVLIGAGMWGYWWWQDRDIRKLMRDM